MDNCCGTGGECDDHPVWTSTPGTMGDQDCTLSSIPTASDWNSNCGTLTQVVLSEAWGDGYCPTPATYVCQPGDGECAGDQDCVMGPSVGASDCTSNCGTVTQTIISQPSGQGAACPTPMTHVCQSGEGSCPIDEDCVMGPTIRDID